MGGQIQGLRALQEREAMADQPFQVHFAVHDKSDGVFLQIDGGAVGSDQSLFIDTDGCRIDQCLSVLRLCKKQYSSPGTGRIHRGTNKGVAANRKNNRVGTTSLSHFADALDYICLRSINCKV